MYAVVVALHRADTATVAAVTTITITTADAAAAAHHVMFYKNAPPLSGWISLSLLQRNRLPRAWFRCAGAHALCYVHAHKYAIL